MRFITFALLVVGSLCLGASNVRISNTKDNKGISINSDGDIAIKSGGRSISISSSGNVSIKAGGNLSLKGAKITQN